MNKGFSMIEVVLCIVIVAALSVYTLGNFSMYTSNPKDVASVIEIQIKATQDIAKAMPSTTGIEVNGQQNMLPYIRFNANSMESISEGSDYKYSLTQRKYTQNNNNKYLIKTDLPDNTVFFNTKALPVDKNGNAISEFHVYIQDSGSFETVGTVTANMYGAVSYK